MKRSRLTTAEKDRRAVERQAVFEAAGYKCQLVGIPEAGRCFGGLTFHHRRKAGQGGGYIRQNGAALCAHHNDEIEADADLAVLAHELGLVVKRGDPEWERLGAEYELLIE